MERNLNKIIENINYHTTIIKEKANNDILASIGYTKQKELSLRQKDMLNYHTQLYSPSLQEKILLYYNK